MARRLDGFSFSVCEMHACMLDLVIRHNTLIPINAPDKPAEKIHLLWFQGLETLSMTVPIAVIACIGLKTTTPSLAILV